jgi:superfamily II DNA or RNA helicase
MPKTVEDDEIRLNELRTRLAALDRERAEVADLIAQITFQRPPKAVASESTTSPNHELNQKSASSEKIGLFRTLFRGREDVFPIRWENARSQKSGYAPACSNEWQRGICEKPRIKCSACSNQAFISCSDTIVARHLKGTSDAGSPFVIGVYPMMVDNTCGFLAVDFDEAEWQRDVLAFARTGRDLGVPIAIERSRSGNGAHAWIFFREPIPAALARQLGSYLVTETMERMPDIGFRSYDRFFPSQDVLAVGGFGNLIALPLQGLSRKADNSVFVDDAFTAYPDQWAYLATLEKVPRARIEDLVNRALSAGRLLAVRIPLADDDETPWLAPPSRRSPPKMNTGIMPHALTVVLGDQLYIPRKDLPPSLVARLVRLASFQNPEFYAAQALRLSTHDKPRVVSCAELTSLHIGLPRGCHDAALDLLTSLDISVAVEDRRAQGQPIEVKFTGVLRPDQVKAIEAIRVHDLGVLAATTAFGKTVIAAKLIAERGVNTLVLVHRRQLMDQWIERLVTFLDCSRSTIGTIGGGKRRPSSSIDIALIQSLVRRGEVDDIVANYGHLIVDECHHLSAVSFELVARRTTARYVLGLSATVTRKDRHHPIIFMQCGPIRHRVDARSEAAKRPFKHLARVRSTTFTLAPEHTGASIAIQQVYRALANDAGRNDLIFDDILRTLEAGRSPVVITERTDHLDHLASRLSRFAKNVFVLRGGRTDRQRRAMAQQLANVPESEERLILATGRYLGEGFDDPRLDTLFLTMPISWKGTLAQYAGRLHRLHDRKRDVVIYDYVDENVPVLARMAAKRRIGYAALGYTIANRDDLFGQET